MRCVWAAAFAASALAAGPALARDTEFRVDLPAGNLVDALMSLSAQTGASVATEADLPPIAARRVTGRLTVRRALERMVEGSPIRVTQVGNNVFRLTRQRHGADRPSLVVENTPRDIVVTARKQSEVLSDVAAPVAVYVPDEGAASGSARTVHDIASRLDGLTLTQVGPGRDKPFIRGIADSPFNGFSQSTVSVQFDDARITYDAAEPGIRLIDVSRVELLKGPQGPLYGTVRAGRSVPNRHKSTGARRNRGFGSSRLHYDRWRRTGGGRRGDNQPAVGE